MRSDADEVGQEPRAAAAVPVAVVGVALYALALLTRLALWRHANVSPDSLDPVLDAVSLVGRGTPPTGPIYGFGRALTYSPMLLAGGWGLAGVWWCRALAQAAIAPLVFFGTRVLLGARRDDPGGLVGPTLAGALVALHQGLLVLLVKGSEAYLAPEWGAVLLLSVLLAARGHLAAPAAAVAGAALYLAMSNHPYALSAAPLVLLCGSGGRPRLNGLAAGVFALLLVPDLVTLSARGGGGDAIGLLSGLRADGNMLGASLFASVQGALRAPLQPDSRVLVAGGLTAAVLGTILSARSAPAGAERGHFRLVGLLGLAVVSGCVSILALSVVLGHAQEWHWLVLLPASAACLGATVSIAFGWALGQRRSVARLGAVALVATVAWASVRPLFVFEARIWEGAREEIGGTLEQLTHVTRLGRVLQGVEPLPQIHGLQLGAEGPAPDLQALRLELALRSRSWLRAPVFSPTVETGRLLLYVEGTSEWLTVIRLDVGGPMLSSGPRHSLWQLSGPVGLERVTRSACQAASGRVVLQHRRNGVGALAACGGEEHSGPE